MQHLSDAGYKMTEPRRRILDTLKAAPEAWTTQQIASHAGTSLASTYRVLALLVTLGMVSEVPDLDAATASPEGRIQRYAICTLPVHHHHFVCRSCHAILEIASDNLEEALSNVAQTYGLSLEHHEVTLSGQCAHCTYDTHDTPNQHIGEV